MKKRAAVFTSAKKHTPKARYLRPEAPDLKHNGMKIFNSLFVKLSIVAVIALLMLIPLAMVKEQVRDRRSSAENAQREVAQSWGYAQTFAGPSLIFFYDKEEKDADGKTTIRHLSETVYPKTLDYEIGVASRKLHRSIYDVMVYNADVQATGSFVIPARLANLNLTKVAVSLGISDLRGIDGNAEIKLGDAVYTFSEGSSGMREAGTYIRENIDPKLLPVDGKTEVPFSLTLKTKGSESLCVKPYGDLTSVRMHSDSPNPSFFGDFLPSEREIRDDGFSASWTVSQINRGKPDDTTFGVRLLESVTQYQKSERSLKYGILIILLVFVAGIGIELIGKKEISLVQYLLIGLSLVLFYALTLSFSEFMAFPLAYALAAAMTVGALTAYFRGILRDSKAWLLGALVAVAYVVSYVLLQMETYAFLAGTLILFAVLAVLMYLTRKAPAGRDLSL